MKNSAVFRTVLLGFAFCCSVAFARDAIQEKAFEVVELKIGKQTLKAEVAITEDQRTRGLMFRKRLPENSGMIFNFGAPARTCMWMKNTYVPLSVAFIDQEGVIVNIEDMEPLTETSHCSQGWVHYALEVNQGWFARNKISVGTRIDGLEKAR